MKTKIVDFDSWDNLIDYSAKTPKTDVATSRDTDRPAWYGTKNHADAVKLARYGWSDAGLNAVDVSSVQFTKLASMVKREDYEYQVTGEILDISAYLSGSPEHWLSPIETFEASSGDVVKIVMNGFFSAGIETDVIKARGAAIVTLVQLLEHAGKRVEFVYHVPFWDKKQFRVTIKRSGDELDVSRLMFVAAHPSMFRRIAFGLYEQHPKEFQSGYGSPHELDGDDKGDIYIPQMGYGDSQWTNSDKAQKWIIENLRKQGVQVG